MPIYEFRCESCSQVFELLAMNKDEELSARCPHCGGENLSRVLSTCASLVDSKPAPGQGPSVQSRSCKNAGSCATITLPGYGD